MVFQGPHTEASRAAISRSKRGRKLSTEHRLKLAAAKLGRKRKPFSAETRLRMSEAARRRGKKPPCPK